MAELLRPETFEFFARYLLAGFIVISVRARLTASRSPKPGEILLDAVVLSMINQVLFLGGRALLESAGILTPSQGNNGVNTVAFYLEILVFPVLLGIVIGRMAGSGTVGLWCDACPCRARTQLRRRMISLLLADNKKAS